MTTKAKPRRMITLKGATATTIIREGDPVTVTISQVPPAARDREQPSGGRAFIKRLEGDPDERVDFSLEIKNTHVGEIVLTSVWPTDVVAIAEAIHAALIEAKRRGIFTHACVYKAEERITTAEWRGYVKPGSVDVHVKKPGAGHSQAVHHA